MAEAKRCCVFFDRDGIVNRSPGPGYVLDWDAFAFEPAFPRILRAVLDKGYVAVVVTNQRGVALGLMSAETLETIHARMRRALREEHGLDLLDVLACTHEKDGCDCRKPAPGMLLAAARRHHLDLAQSWMIGDHARDVEAGRRAGCRTVRVGGADAAGADVHVARLEDLPAVIEAVF
jgi:D-glycero-D-manno-heptose 1,7-bisphosphate phosphatase